MGAFVLSLGTFLWFHEQSDALALAVAFSVQSAFLAYFIAFGDWIALGVSSPKPRPSLRRIFNRFSFDLAHLANFPRLGPLSSPRPADAQRTPYGCLGRGDGPARLQRRRPRLIRPDTSSATRLEGARSAQRGLSDGPAGPAPSWHAPRG